MSKRKHATTATSMMSVNTALALILPVFGSLMFSSMRRDKLLVSLGMSCG